MKTNTYAYSDVYFISAKFHDEIGFDVVYAKSVAFTVNSVCVRKL